MELPKSLTDKSSLRWFRTLNLVIDACQERTGQSFIEFILSLDGTTDRELIENIRILMEKDGGQ